VETQDPPVKLVSLEHLELQDQRVKRVNPDQLEVVVSQDLPGLLGHRVLKVQGETMDLLVFKAVQDLKA